jgi:esterase
VNGTLHSISAGEGRDVILLHGLFGQGGNLKGVARALQSEFRVHCLDLPDHGRSCWLEQASLEDYANAVEQWMVQQGLESAHVLGHSLGGKVAMQLALNHGDRVSTLVVADIAPVPYTGNHQEILAAMAAVAARRCQTRREAEAVLAQAIDDPGVVGYLLMSLTRVNDVYEWKLNLAGLAAGYERLREAPSGETAFPGATLFVKGGDSPYIQAGHEPEIARRFPHSYVKTIDGAGHWVHIDQPGQFFEIVRSHLRGFPGGQRPE